MLGAPLWHEAHERHGCNQWARVIKRPQALGQPAASHMWISLVTRQCKLLRSSVLQTPRCESRRVAVSRATPAASDPYSRSFFVVVFYAFACIMVACMLISLGCRSLPQFLENFSHKLCSCIHSFLALPSPAHPSSKDLLVHFPVSAISNHSTRR